MQDGRRILVGAIGAAQGIKGEVRIKSYTGRPTAIADYGALFGADGRSFKILSLRPLKDDMVVARIEGVADRDAAAALTNTRLYVDRASLPPPDDDEFYQADLIGLEARTPDGDVLGRVASVENYGAGDLLEIVPAAGDATLLVPFTRTFVPVIDFAQGHLVVEPGALGEAGDDPEDGDAGRPPPEGA